VKEQASQIQKVTAPLEASKPTPRVGQQSLKPRPPQQSSSISRSAVMLSGVAAFVLPGSPLFEIARVLVRFDHVTSFIVNADHSIM